MTTETENVNAVFRDVMAKMITESPVLQEIFGSGREARWRYFGKLSGRSKAYAWSTERVDGKYESWMWQPVKNGWERRKTIKHARRKAAKARALRLFEASK